MLRKGLALLALMLLILACGSFPGGKSSGQSEEQPQPVTSSPAASESSSSGFHSPGEDDTLSSYRVVQQFSVESPLVDPSPQVVLKVVIEHQQQPQPLTHVAVYQGKSLTLTSESYQLQDRVYLREGKEGNWVILPGGEDWSDLVGIGSGFLAPDEDLLGLLEEGKNATYEGMPVKHYHWETTDPDYLPDATDWIPDESVLGENRFEPKKASVDIYATEDGLLVKETLRVEGRLTLENGQSGPAAGVWEIEVSDINKNLNLQVPADLAVAQQAPLPLPDNAQIQVSTSDMTVFLVPQMSVDDLLQYWRDHGVTIKSTVGSASVGMEVTALTPDGKEITVLVGPGSGGVLVSFGGP